MKYTDGLLSFPVRVYDGYSIKKAMKREQDMDIPADGDWVEGRASIPFSEVKGMIDYIPRGTTISSIEDGGFDCCVVVTNTLGDLICNEPQDKFEQRLNRFAERYTEQVEQMVEDRLEEKLASLPKPKKPWWKRKSA